MNKRLAIVMIILLLAPLFYALSFTQNPTINDGLLVFTDDDLVCEWQYSGDATSQNITVYQDGQVFLTQNETGSLNTSVTIASANTTKNEVWICQVALGNGTATTTSMRNVTIQNSAPETPTIYASDIDIGTSYSVDEDTTYTFDVNSSDLDNDTLTYYFKAATQGFCTMTDTGAGTASCTPTQAYHDDSATDVNITFWVDDDDVLFAKSASTKVTFTVNPVNDAPIASLANQSTPVNETLTYQFDASDEENNTPLTFSLVNPPAEIAGKLSVSSLDNDTGQLVYDASSPDFNDVNQTGWIITINTTDSLGASRLQTMLLNISSVGRTPELLNFSPAPNAQGRYVINQDENIIILINATDADANDVHTYRDDTAITSFITSTIQSDVNVSNTTGRINYTASNDDVGDFSVTITVEDRELLTDTIQLNFTVNNINDAPIVYEESTYAINTNDNANMTNVTSYATAPFVFRVNATDPDLPYGDALTYSDNTSLFTINATTGIINFTPSVGDVQSTPYSINITVSDNQSVVASRVMNLWILANTPPYFDPTPLPILSCAEGENCVYNLSAYALEGDAGDFISSYAIANTTGVSSFSYNSTTGLINFTPNQDEVGTYNFNVTIQDTRGATNSTALSVEINNTEEAPILLRYDFSTSTIVEDHAFTFQLQASDRDLLAPNSTENLTFLDNLSFTDIDTYSTTLNTTYATLSMVPTSGDVGTHSINITVNDSTGRQDTQIFSFTVLPDSEPPQIEQILPYPNTSASNAPIESFIATASLGANNTSLAFAENNTYLFAHVTTDDLTPTGSLVTRWYYDGSLVATTWNYTRTFNFTSSGSHTLQLIVNDTYLETANFTWNLGITNVNRNPLLLNNLSVIDPLNTTTILSNYLTFYNSSTRFIDPDDDINANNVIGSGETSTLTFSATTCLGNGGITIADIAISSSSVSIDPVNEGTCTVIFTATDQSGESLQSNPITINVTDPPEGEEETVTESTPSGGGGSTSRSSFIPITRETQTPEPVNILAPKIVTIYDNNSIIIPFDVENTWSETLEYIQLDVGSNASEVTTTLSSNIIETLAPNQSVELYLEVANYRLGNNYEIELRANVSSPAFEDTAIILLSSIEQASQGEEVEVKVTFARDLFNEHPECQELNELLDQANVELKNQNFAEARKLVDTAINGCRYIVSTLQQTTERPDALPSIISLSEPTLATLLYATLVLIIIATIGFVIYYHYTNTDEDDI